MEKKDIEIPFGAFDSELGGFEYTIPEGYKAEIKDGKVVVRKTESEGERIMKEIIATIHLYYGEPLENEAKEMIAWLEKQDEQKPADKVEPKFKVKYAGSEYNVFETKDIAGVTFYGIEDEPNHIDYVKAENCEIIGGYGIKENGSLYPTKPAKFSEQKPAWSEEDEINRDLVYNALVQVYDMAHNKDLSTWINKRILLCSQQQWKPSDKQIDALEDAIADAVSSIQKNMLNSLYSDLKKL